MGLTDLPVNYRLAREIDMRKDKKMAFWLNIAGTAVFLVLCVIGYFIHPIAASDIQQPFMQAVALIGGLFVYIILHELTHALFMRIFIHEHVNFGFHVYAAYAGMKNGYFRRHEYVVVALAPVILLGCLLVLLTFLFPAWFWVLFIIQGQNVAGAVGDYFVIYLLSRTPKDTLVNDDGMSMRYYVIDTSKPIYEKSSDDDFPDLQ